MIKVENLRKTFGSKIAVNDISFEVQPGEVLGFLGPNGAGKSTTMRILTGFIRPTSGRASVCGFDVDANPLEVKRRVGYLPEAAPSYAEMSVESFLGWAADMRGPQPVASDFWHRRAGKRSTKPWMRAPFPAFCTSPSIRFPRGFAIAPASLRPFFTIPRC